jgi:hypothetical protein
MNFKQLYQKPLILPLFIGFTYVCLILDTIKYPGFIGNHFVIDTKVYLAVTLVWLSFFTSKSFFLNFVLKVNRLLLPLIFIVYMVLNALEGGHYRNYVLATLEIHLEGFTGLVLFGLLLVLVDKFKSLLPKGIKALGILYPIFIYLIALFLIKSLIYVTDQSFKRDSYVIFHPLSSYDEKMFYEWGDFYKFMVFVRNNTPSDANIVTPPTEDPWLMGSGNVHFVRAYLFPRKIIKEEKIISDINKFGPNTYVLITWGKEECKPEGCHGWPRQDIKAKKIIYKDPNSTNVIEERENTTYHLEDDKYVYGLIEL